MHVLFLKCMSYMSCNAIIGENMEDLLRVGVISSAHGIKGEVNVFPTTSDSCARCKVF